MDTKRLIAGVAIMAATYLATRRRSGTSSVALDVEMVAGVPFAGGSPAPAWPVLSKGPDRFSIGYISASGEKHGNQSRRFGAQRPDGRRHAGIDVYAKDGDVLVASEPGVVTMVRNTFNLGTGILFLATDSGITLAYGEIDPGSWGEFGVKTGSRVARGQRLARVGCMSRDDSGDCDSHMLHFETYAGKVTKNTSWYASSGPPAGLLNPTAYLLRARISAGVA